MASPPKHVGLHLPYGWDDASQMAIPIADWIAQIDRVPIWLAGQSLLRGVNRIWDGRVLSERKHDYLDWLTKCRHTIWFDVQRDKLEIAKAMGVECTLVVLWHRLSLLDL